MLWSRDRATEIGMISDPPNISGIARHLLGHRIVKPLCPRFTVIGPISLDLAQIVDDVTAPEDQDTFLPHRLQHRPPLDVLVWTCVVEGMSVSVRESHGGGR